MDETLIRFRAELERSAERRVQARRRRVRTLTALAAAGALLVTGAAIAADHLRDSLGSPAPENVRRDFGSYTPQLGFHPAGSDAVLSAEDERGGIGLYVAPNAEGTSCVTFTAPWKTSPDQEDGGTCLRHADAEVPILAGLLGTRAARPGPVTAVIGGRVTTEGAVSVRFPSASGEPIESTLGIGGYFVVAVPGAQAGLTPGGCDGWAPQVTALDAAGQALARATIVFSQSVTGACGWPMGLHGAR
jgi:hypothetical protein